METKWLSLNGKLLQLWKESLQMNNIWIPTVILSFLLIVYIIVTIMDIIGREKIKDDWEVFTVTILNQIKDMMTSFNQELFESMLKAKSYRPRKQNYNNHGSAWRYAGESKWKEEGKPMHYRKKFTRMSDLAAAEQEKFDYGKRQYGNQGEVIDEFFEQKVIDAKVVEKEQEKNL